MIADLLTIQGWPLNRPPKGRVVLQNEYKAFPELEDIFKGKSKSGSGDAYPDYLIVSDQTLRPQMIVEAKADEREIGKAIVESQLYAKACMDAGHAVIAVGVAGQEKTAINVSVTKFYNGGWAPVSYQGAPISWIPRPADITTLLSSDEIVDLAPVIPSPDVLAEKADLINRILREAHVKDEYRPAYVGAMMLALWKSQGRIRKDPEYILEDINRECERAFTAGGKAELAHSLRIDEANTKLAGSAWRIVATLQKLNVVTASFAHDYLGHLYEAFFRYTGGNTIGQYFTPRHIARFMADICDTTSDDIVIDPACGTGGFLIAHLQRCYGTSISGVSRLRYEDVVSLIQNKLLGYESELVTAALCVANMILRGDGKTGINKEDCFTAPDYPTGACQVALMNPPFPHKNTDIVPQRFVERALDALEQRGKLAVILPTSLLVRKDIGVWRENILKNHSLLSVCQLPDELFQPYASATTSVALLEKGIPHNDKRKSVFVRLQYDGLTLRKGSRVERSDQKNEIPKAVDAILNKLAEPGFSGVASLSGRAEWSPGAYIPSAIPTIGELQASIDELLRRLTSFYVRYAVQVATLRDRISNGDLTARPYREIAGAARVANAQALPSEPGTIGELFDILYGQKELHSREGIPPGDSLVVSPTEEYNGCYGWLSFEHLIQAPFVTVAQTGTIGEAFVQLEPCGVNDDCLILLPKENSQLPTSCLLIAAAIIRLERWRFSYGRKLTPSRICGFAMKRMPDLEAWADEQLTKWRKIAESAVNSYAPVQENNAPEVE